MERRAESSGWPNVIPVLMAVTALAAAWIAYRPGFSGGFYFDDLQNIVESSAVHWKNLSWAEIERTRSAANLPVRLLPNLSFGLNHLYGELDPTGYHLVNWVVHVVVGGVLAWVCLLYVRRGPQTSSPRYLSHVAVAVSGLFVLHPLATQSVTYIVQRMSSMAALFSLLSFGLYLSGRRRDPGRRAVFLYGAAVLVWLMAVLSKENAFMLPLVVLAHELCFHPATWKRLVATGVRTPRGRAASIAAVVAATLTVLLLWNSFNLSDGVHLTETWPNREYNGVERVLTQSRVQILYLSLLFWPAPGRLSLEHAFSVSRSIVDPWTTLPALLFWAAVTGIAVLGARKYPRFFFPILAYLLLHGIEAGPINLEIAFEHRMYLPVAFLALLPATGMAALPVRPRLVAIVLVIGLWIPAATATWKRNTTWGDPLAFHRDVALKSPNLYRPQYNLGTLLGQHGRLDEAREALERALSLKPGSSEANNQLANTYFLRGDLTRAEAHYREAVRLAPGNYEAIYNVAMTLDEAGRFKEAVDWYGRFLEAVPPHLEWKIPEVKQRMRLLGSMPDSSENRTR